MNEETRTTHGIGQHVTPGPLRATPEPAPPSRDSIDELMSGMAQEVGELRDQTMLLIQRVSPLLRPLPEDPPLAHDAAGSGAQDSPLCLEVRTQIHQLVALRAHVVVAQKALQV